MRIARCMLAWLASLCVPAAIAAEVPRAYPAKIPADVTFQDVVKSQPYPAMKYPVPIIGWKHHPEEVHVTPTGALVFPRPDATGGLYLAPLLGAPDRVPALLPANAADRSLVDGYMPCVQSAWVPDGLRVKQAAFATLLSGTEVRTGREVLVAMERLSVSNLSRGPRRITLWLNFGAARPGHSINFVPPTYDHRLAFRAPLVTEPDGRVAACVLRADGRTSFRPLPEQAQADASRSVTLNAEEKEVVGPAYAVEVARNGDAVTVGGWTSQHGADLTFEASRIHGLAVAMDVEVVTPDGAVQRVGKLFRTGLFQELRPAAEYVAPGQHAAPVPWSVLSLYLPQGKSRIVLRSYYPTESGPVAPGSWEPIVHFSEPGTLPRFKVAGSGDPRENSLRVDLDLPPGAVRTVEVAVPYFPLPTSQAAALRGLRFDERLAAFRRYWAHELNRNAQFVIPEKRIRDSYRACLAYNEMLVDRDPATGLLLPHPDPTAYEAVWAGDSGVIVEAMDRLGYHAEAAGYLDYFLKKQGTRKPDADVTDWRGFFTGDAGPKWISENGFILWAMAQHYRLTGDKAWLRRVAGPMIRSADWIIRQRARTKVLENGEKPAWYGLLPKGAPSDIGEWDHWYWSDTYSYMGLRGAADVLAEIGDHRAARFDAEARDYKACILASLSRSINRKVSPPFVPPAPDKNGSPSADLVYATWYSICSPIYMVEAGLFPATDPKATWTDDWLEKYGLYSGLPSFGAAAIDPHYVYNQSITQLLRGETGKFLWTFYSLFAYGQSRSTYATIESINLLSGSNGEAWDANRQPHMHSNSRVLDMVRAALLLENGPRLHLLAGTPTGWLAPGQTVAVRKAPTEFGDVSLSARSETGRREVRVSIAPPARHTASLILHVRPPSNYGTLRAVTVNGKPWAKFRGREVDLGRRTDRTEVVCRF